MKTSSIADHRLEPRTSGSLTEEAAAVSTRQELALLLRELRRRQGRQRADTPLTYRELAAKTGWSRGIIGEYLVGNVLPRTDRFDALIRLLGATPAEQGALATARDRVEEHQRGSQPAPDVIGSARPLPRQLPTDVSGFVGRTRALAELDRLLLAGRRQPAVTILVLTGTAGVGMTFHDLLRAYALELAHTADTDALIPPPQP